MSTLSKTSAYERWRKPISFIFAAVWLSAAIFFRPIGLDAGWYSAMELLGFLFLIIAALGRLWAYAYIGGRKNAQLCVDGPYALTRNPLYLFSFVGLVGASLAVQNIWLSLGSAAFFLAYYAPVIRAEERRLAALFGEPFAAYRAAVPRFWPRFIRISDQGDLTVSVRLFNRTLTEVFWFLAAIILIELLEAGKLGGLWPQWSVPF